MSLCKLVILGKRERKYWVGIGKFGLNSRWGNLICQFKINILGKGVRNYLIDIRK